MLVKDFDVIMDPAKYGYTVCTWCNGYGSSLLEEIQKCSKCHGLGLVKQK